MFADNEPPVEDDSFDLQKFLPKKWYDALKALAAPVLPALATLVLVIGPSWDWSNSEKFAGALTAVSVFLGVLTSRSAKRFQKATNVGDVVVTKTDEGKVVYSLEVGVPLEQIEKLDTLTFGVKQAPQE